MENLPGVQEWEGLSLGPPFRKERERVGHPRLLVSAHELEGCATRPFEAPLKPKPGLNGPLTSIPSMLVFSGVRDG
jgi:hypothetical protein